MTATFDGLKNGTEYWYSLTAYDADNRILSQYTGMCHTSNGTSGIENINRPEIYQNADGIVISGAEGMDVTVTDIAGITYHKGTIINNKTAIKVPASNTYLIKTGNKTHKLFVR